MLQHIGVALGFLQTAVPVAGVPIAAGIALEIVKTCQEVAQQKGLAKSLGEKCTALANALQDESSGLEGTALQTRIDEVVDVLKNTLKCARRWRNQNLITQWFRRIDMAREIEQCHRNLDNAIKEFELRNQISIQREQKDAREENTVLHMESREILLKIFESQVEMQRIVTLHQAGQPAARDLMKNGQEMLREIRLELQGSSQVVVTGAEHSGPGPSSAPSPPSAPNRQVAAQQYREVQRGMAMLHRMTAILPPNKILNGEVRRMDNLAIAGGSSSDIWRGLWLEAEKLKVALKGMRSIRIDAEGAQKRFVREIEVWSRLNNGHILQFYGIATDLGPHIHIVSPWLENGGVLE
ncbi:hypothetical protein P691DRAFT_807000 [Macrolepiota fuliginosa MF-IS2]|uniref:Protein kinase domain-containing protein n=1 Tax=Macrolepiota fuliginosa MF-IS2 TaxID=1400762 RepID=A0A9P6BY29_9AGAR|nr:hypothetical protein P691DRAFT_807000 [Macrolepiota fuliginosa MF-IS2]